MKPAGVFKKVLSDFAEEDQLSIFNTANRAGEILAACIIADALNNLAKSIKCLKQK